MRLKVWMMGVGCVVMMGLAMQSCGSGENQKEGEENGTVSACCTKACTKECRETCKGNGHVCDKDPNDRSCCVGPDGKKKKQCCDSEYSDDKCCQEV